MSESGFRREVSIYERIYNGCPNYEGFYIENGQALAENDIPIYFSITRYEKSDNLLNFLTLVTKMPEPTCKYFLR